MYTSPELEHSRNSLERNDPYILRREIEQYTDKNLICVSKNIGVVNTLYI